MSYRFVSTDESSSETSTSWISTSSDSSDQEEEYNGPEPKKLKKSSDKSFVESELTYENVLRAGFKWNIKDYSKVSSEKEPSGKLESPIFTVGDEDELKWRLQLYPKGINEQNKNYIALYLCLVSSKEPKTRVQYNCYIWRDGRKQDRESLNEEYFSEGQRFGYKRFKKIDSSFKRFYLENDRLIIACDINAFISKTPANKIKVVNDIEALMDSGNYSDVTLEVNKQKFKAHKFILAARSPVFAAMFNHDMKEKKQSVVEIDDIECDVMKELLRFTYTGEVHNLNTKAKDLLAAADKYAFEDLKLMCENSLFESLNIHNVVDILNFAELHTATKLKDQALEFLVCNVRDVVETPSFKSMGSTQSPLLAEVICKMALQKN